MSPETTYRQPYGQMVALGRPVPMVLAGTRVPDTIRTDVQLARRIIHVPLGAGAVGHDWRSGGIDARTWRAADPPNTDAADRLVSDVIDLVRRHGTFEGFAAAVGFRTFQAGAADTGEDPDAPFRDLFAAVIAAPDYAGGGFWQGRGWKVFHVDDGTHPLAAAWAECGGGGPVDPQLITGRQWGVTLNVPGVECDLLPHGRKVGIRFRVGSVRGKVARFNRELLPAGHPLAGPVENVVSIGAGRLPTPQQTVTDLPTVATVDP